MIKSKRNTVSYVLIFIVISIFLEAIHPIFGGIWDALLGSSWRSDLRYTLLAIGIPSNVVAGFFSYAILDMPKLCLVFVLACSIAYFKKEYSVRRVGGLGLFVAIVGWIVSYLVRRWMGLDHLGRGPVLSIVSFAHISASVTFLDILR